VTGGAGADFFQQADQHSTDFHRFRMALIEDPPRDQAGVDARPRRAALRKPARELIDR